MTLKKQKVQEVVQTPNKKLVSFKNYAVLGGLIQDHATVEKNSESAIIENILSNALLSPSDRTTDLISMVYDDNYKLKGTVAYLLSELSACIGYNKSYTNALPLIELCLQFTNRPFCSGINLSLRNKWGYFQDTAKLLLQKLEYAYQDSTILEEKQRLAEYKLLFSLPHEDFVPFNYFSLVLNEWDILGTSTYTYRFLYTVLELTSPECNAWEDTAQNRLALCKVIRDITPTWRE
jgi:hypothetical protein